MARKKKIKVSARRRRTGWARKSQIRQVNKELRGAKATRKRGLPPAAARAADWKGEPPRQQPVRAIADIKIGKRHRKRFGDLAALAADINERGLLHPVVIDRDNNLIAGERRVRAWQLSIFRNEPIPVHVVPLKNIVAGEWAENDPRLREDFTPSEAVAIKQAIEAELKPVARARMSQGGGSARTKVAPADKLSAGDRAAAFTGKSRRTVEKAEQIVAAAEENPERFGKLQEDMDRTGRVDGPFKRLQVMKAGDAIRQAPPGVPMQGPYGTIVFDYPWPNEPDMTQEELDAQGRSLRPYPAMAIEAGCKFMAEQARPILAETCTVYFWTTNYHLINGHAGKLLHALGFDERSTMLTWGKDKLGRGQVLRDKTEHCIIAKRGKPVIDLTNETTLLLAPRRENSRKPDEFYALVEKLTPAPRYAEIFSRGGRGPLWDCHGDQVGMFATANIADVLGEMNKKAGAAGPDGQAPADAPAAGGNASPPARGFFAYEHPCLAVACPTCRAKIGVWCKRPSGHKAMDLHAERKKAADAAWEKAGSPDLAPAHPTGDDVPATSQYQADLGFRNAGEYRVTPAGQKIVPEIVKPGMLVRTNYGSGPYEVLEVSRHVYRPERGKKFVSWSLALLRIDDKKKSRRRQANAWINEVVAVDGRLLMLFVANTDEVFIVDETQQADMAEWKALGAVEADVQIQGPLVEVLVERRLIERVAGVPLLITDAGRARLAELDARFNPAALEPLDAASAGETDQGSPQPAQTKKPRKRGARAAQRDLPLAGGRGTEDPAAAIRRQLTKEFPDGLAGHVITHTIDWDAGAGVGESVAACQCGVTYRASRDLPVSGHDELDKHILAHWRAMSTAPLQTSEAAE